MELVYVSALDAEFCEFESHRAHHLRGFSSVGRTPALHAGGRRFDPDILHHIGIVTQLTE